MNPQRTAFPTPNPRIGLLAALLALPLAGPAAGRTTYHAAVPRDVHAVLADHRFRRSAARLAGRPDPEACRRYVRSHPGTWYHAAGQLEINTGRRDPRTDGRVYTACVRDDVVFTSGKH